MSKEGALRVLETHSMTCLPAEEVGTELRRDSFVAHLRPFDSLNRRFLSDPMSAIQALSAEIRENDPEVMKPLRYILEEGWTMAVDPAGRLSQDGLIPDEERRVVAKLLFCIGYAVVSLQGGIETAEAFLPFRADFGF